MQAQPARGRSLGMPAAETDCQYCNHFKYSNHTYSVELTHTVHEHHSQTLCEPLLWGKHGWAGSHHKMLGTQPEGKHMQDRNCQRYHMAGNFRCPNFWENTISLPEEIFAVIFSRLV